MSHDKLLSLLGLAKKAGRISLGYEKSLEAIHKNKAYVVFTALDLSEKTERGLLFACENCGTSKNKIKRVDYDIFQISEAVGQKTGIVSVNDAGFGKKCLELLENASKNDGNGGTIL